MKWVVDVKGKANESFEISVLLSDNTHGKKSYGWFGEDKLFISGSGGPCDDHVTKRIFDKLMAVAHEVAAELNEEKGEDE
jgi:hypothetical protein